MKMFDRINTSKWILYISLAFQVSGWYFLFSEDNLSLSIDMFAIALLFGVCYTLTKPKKLRKIYNGPAQTNKQKS